MSFRAFRRCSVDGCVNPPAVMTEREGSRADWCTDHRDRTATLVEIYDWRAVDQAEREGLDLRDACAELDDSIGGVWYGAGFHLVHATRPTLLAVLREIAYSPNAYPATLASIWSVPAEATPRANQAWHQDRPEGRVPVTKSTHLLPIPQLAAILGDLRDARARAFVADLLWCATGDRRTYGDLAVANYITVLRTDAAELCASDSALAQQPGSDGRVADIHLHHFTRGLALASNSMTSTHALRSSTGHGPSDRIQMQFLDW